MTTEADDEDEEEADLFLGQRSGDEKLKLAASTESKGVELTEIDSYPSLSLLSRISPSGPLITVTVYLSRADNNQWLDGWTDG